MYSDRSTALGNGAEDLWWLVRDGGAGRLWRTSGIQFVRQLQQALRLMPGTIRSFDGNAVSGSQVNVDGKWGPITSRVLWNMLRTLSAPAELRGAVEADARARTLTRGSVAAAAWLLSNRPQLANLDVPADVVAPLWSTEPPLAASLGTPASSISLDDPALRARNPIPVVEAPVPIVAPEPTATPPERPTQPLETTDVARNVPVPTGLETPTRSGAPPVVSWKVLLGVGAGLTAAYLLARAVIAREGPRGAMRGRRTPARAAAKRGGRRRR